MHETWVEDKDFRIYDIKKKQKNSRSQYFNSWYKKKHIIKYSNCLCTACNGADEKLLKVDCEEIKEKEQDEDDHQQTPIDNEIRNDGR